MNDREAISDRDLLDACADDASSFAVLYRRYARRLLAYFYRRTASAETAADLTAETFAAVYERRAAFRGEDDASSWIFGIAHHLLARYLRRGSIDQRARRRLGVATPHLDDESHRRIEDLDDLRAVIPLLERGVDALSLAERQAVALRVVDGLDYDAVAERLGCTNGAARVRVARALKRLRTHLEQGVEP